MPLEIEEEIHNSPLKTCPEARFPAEFPLAIDDLERNILVRRPCPSIIAEAHVSKIGMEQKYSADSEACCALLTCREA